MVRFDNVGMRYGSGPEVLRDITFELAPGSFYFLTGPSGAGKSTLLRLLYLAQRPTRGLITLFDKDLATLPRHELPALRRRIGVVFQEFRLIEHLTALENVALPLKVASARAVIGRPALLLADEPTGNVDDRIAVRLIYLFEELNKMGTTVVVATHNESLIARFQHPALHLDKGELTLRQPLRAAAP